MIAINAIAIAAVIYMISVLPRHRDIIHQRQIFPQLIERLQTQTADEARVKSLRLLQKSNHALDNYVSLVESLTYSTLAILLLNAGVLLFCVFQFRRTQMPARSADSPGS
jgi:hypothetical protein